MTIVWSTSL